MREPVIRVASDSTYFSGETCLLGVQVAHFRCQALSATLVVFGTRKRIRHHLPGAGMNRHSHALVVLVGLLLLEEPVWRESELALVVILDRRAVDGERIEVPAERAHGAVQMQPGADHALEIGAARDPCSRNQVVALAEALEDIDRACPSAHREEVKACSGS